MRGINSKEGFIPGWSPLRRARVIGFSWPAIPVLLSLLFALLLPIGLHAQNYTLEDILSTPFPSGLIAAPNLDLVAWVFDSRGMRNIWVAEAPDYQARQLTNYDQDDGQELGELSFSPDGSVIVYVRGGSANQQGEYPNPTSDPKGAEQAVWAIKVAGGEPWRLGGGNHPVVSPAGDLVVFNYRGKLYVASLDGSKEAKPLFEGRGRNGSPCWSPDGSQLAFVSQRDDHSFIGVYHLQAKTITWMMPDVERDDHPVWSPDGRWIAFIRFPGATADFTFRLGFNLPFAIWVADAKTGKGKEVWKSPDNSGGFAQYYPAHPLMWAAEDRLLFYSEHEGWMHIYSVSVKGGKAICLTPGECEAEHATLSVDRRTLIFNSNCGDIDLRHLWSVPVTGGNPQQLTTGKGIEWSPVVLAGGKNIMFFCSTARQPATPAIISISGGQPRLIAPQAIPSQFPRGVLVEPQQVIFKAPDGLDIHGQLFLPPKGIAGSKFPAVIFMHGGPIRQMLLGWHYLYYYHNSYAMNQYLASRGYVVLSVNFRSGIGYGRAFRTAPNQGPRGASEYQDIVAAGKYLQSRPEVDPQKIGLWGGSYGGYLTAMGLARDSELFAAGVDLHGVHDWSMRGRRRQGGGWGLQGEELLRLAYDSSPVADINFWSSPVLFIHGDDDRNVDFIQTTDLVQRLRALGKAHIETLVFPDDVHDFLLHRNWLRAYKAAADFFDRFLKGKAY